VLSAAARPLDIKVPVPGRSLGYWKIFSIGATINPTVTKMTSNIEFVSCHEALPKTIKYCKTCQRETFHQIREGRGLAANICISCLERALAWEQDRD
jgi:hypothetical protein